MARSITTMTQTRVDKLVREPARKDHSDHQVTGLYLRQNMTGATWQVRVRVNGDNKKRTIGSPPAINLVQARQIATAGISRLRQGYDLDDRWLDEQRVALGLQVESAPLASIPRVRPRGLLYEDAVASFIESMDGVRRAATRTSYKHILTNPAVREALYGKAVAEIDRRKVAHIVEAMAKEGKYSTGELLVTVIKILWGYLSSDTQSEKTGVRENVMLPLKRPQRPESKPLGHTVVVPELMTIGKAVAACRAGVLHPTVSLALEFLVYTVQRRETVAGAHVDDMRLDERLPFWAIDRTRQKGRVEHHIPLTGRALEIARIAVEQARASGSEYLFPQVREARNKETAGDLGHIGVWGLTHDMKDASGTSPHRVRHAFISHLVDEEIIDDAQGALILDHLEGRRTTTARRYKRAKELAKKIRILRHWIELIEGPIRDAIDVYDPAVEKPLIQAARRNRTKTKKLSESRRHRKAMDAIGKARDAMKAADEAEKQFMLQVSEDHRTGHMKDEEAVHALRLRNVHELVLGRILLGHDLYERPDFHPLRDEIFRKYPDIKAAHDRARAAREVEIVPHNLEAAE